MADFPARPPRTRGDCADGPRPCPFTACRYHLFHEAVAKGDDVDLGGTAATCALDVAERGGSTLEEIAVILGVTRERIRQIESRAIRSLREGPGLAVLAEVLGVESRPVEAAQACPRRRQRKGQPGNGAGEADPDPVPLTASRARPVARRRAG